MDHNNKERRKWLLGLLGCLAGLVIIIVLEGAFMFRHEIKTLGTLERIDNNVLYSTRYGRSHGFNDSLEIGTNTDGELVRFVTERLLKGLPFEFSIPDLGCSTFSAWTKEGDCIFGRNSDLIYSLTLIMETVPSHEYRSLSTVNLTFLGFGEGNLPDSLREKLIILAVPYAPLDNINEESLAATALHITDEPMNQDTGKTDVTTVTAIRLTLGKAAMVDGAAESLEQYDIHSSAGSCYHFQVTDAEGNGAAMECADNELVVLGTEQDYQMTTSFLLSDKKYGFGSGQSRCEILETSLDNCNGVVEDEQADMDLLQAASKD